MVFINEWLPNPIGSDAGEWIELFNDGKTSISLTGWRIETDRGRKLFLSGKNIKAGKFLILNRKETKLSLGNKDGGLSLYDAAGKLVDKASFSGVAQEGKSFSRVSSGLLGTNKFTFTEPTPGAQNSLLPAVQIFNNKYPFGESLNRGSGGMEFVWLAVGVAVLLTGLVLFAIKRNEELSKLFFGGNEAIR